MTEQSKDILKKLCREDVAKLRKLYEEDFPFSIMGYNFLRSAEEIFVKQPDDPCITVFSPYGDVNNKTFIALIQMNSYGLFIFTLDKTCEILYKALHETKLIDWHNNAIVVYSVHESFSNMLDQVLKDINVPKHLAVLNNFYSIPKDEAKQFSVECPQDFYIDILTPENAETINNVWPHRHEGSELYIRNIISVNGGIGIFTKNEKILVAWVLKNLVGMMGMLQTDENYKRKGLGSLLVKLISKQLADEGYVPSATVVSGNAASENMFERIGFVSLEKCNYTFVGQDKRIELPENVN